MSSITADDVAAAIPAGEPVGPLEQKHLQFANSRLSPSPFPVLMIAMAIGVTMMVPEHSGKGAERDHRVRGMKSPRVVSANTRHTSLHVVPAKAGTHTA